MRNMTIQMSPAIRRARKIRPIQRRRSSAGSLAKPTGETYSSRIDKESYRAERGDAGSRLDGDALADRAVAPDRSAFFLGHATPDAGILAGRERPLEAGPLNLARTADGSRGFDLSKGRAGGPDRKEEFRVDVSTRGVVTPIHHRRIHERATPPATGVNNFSSWWERARAYNPAFESGNTFREITWCELGQLAALRGNRSPGARARVRKRPHERT